MFIDFVDLKNRVSIEEVASFLKITMQVRNGQLRGPCPTCKSGGDRALVITPAKTAFFCFASRKGGDQIALAAHILNTSVKEAAQRLAEWKGIVPVQDTVPRNSTVPESASGDGGNRTFQPLAYLEHDHPAVLAIGFDPQIAKELGVGYAPKGIMRGTVAIPVRDEKGILKGYIGVEEARLPPSFMGKNVVELKSA